MSLVAVVLVALPHHLRRGVRDGPANEAGAPAFYRAVVAHHQRGVTVVDEYLPKAKRANLKATAEQMKRHQQAEIQEFEPKAGTS